MYIYMHTHTRLNMTINTSDLAQTTFSSQFTVLEVFSTLKSICT